MTSAIYAVVISQAAASDTWSTWSSIVSNTQIKLTNNYGPGSWWCVIGKQQWGYATRSGVGDTTFTFPISFSTIYCVNAGRYFSSRDSSNSGFGVMSQSTTTCVTYTGASQTKAMTILAIGIQQWGKAVRNAEFSYPLSLSVLLGLYATQTGSYSGAYALVSSTATTSKAKFESNKVDNLFFLVIGKQQWGKKAQGASNTVSFPVSFSTIYSLTTCVWANQAIGGDYGTAGSVSTKSFVTYCGEPLGWIATGKQLFSYCQPSHILLCRPRH